MTSGMSALRTLDDDGVRHLILDRPEARNALDGALVKRLTDAILAADADPEVRVVVLRGEGPGFCAGADLKETARIEDEAAAAAHARRMRELLEAPQRIGKPLVCEVHGFALGAGCALALACDVMVATPDARLGFPEMRHQVVPALVVPGFVQRVGAAVAFDWLANGRIVAAAASHFPGLICVGDGEDLRGEVERRARELADKPAPLLEAVKRLVRLAAAGDPQAAMDGAERMNVENRLRRARTARQA